MEMSFRTSYATVENTVMQYSIISKYTSYLLYKRHEISVVELRDI